MCIRHQNKRRQQQSHRRFGLTHLFLWSWAFCLTPGMGYAQNGILQHLPSNMQFSGTVSKRTEFISASNRQTELLSVTDGVRRVTMKRQTGRFQADARSFTRPIELPQRTIEVGRSSISAVGTTLQRLPFNEFGRRKVYVDTNKGPVWLLQGITELAPTFARVQGIEMEGEKLFEFPFDLRIATSTIPSDTLVKMLRNAVDDLSDYDQRERIVEFLIESERYPDAQRELNFLLADFKNLDRERFNIIKTRLATTSARLVLNELDMRQDAGQFETVRNILNSFDTQDLSPETLEDISRRRRDLENTENQLKQFKETIAAEFDVHLKSDTVDEDTKQRLTQLREEILRDLNPHNVNRLATYDLRSKDSDSTAQSRLSFLVSGWLLGAVDAIDNLAVAVSGLQARDLLIEYLQSNNANRREEIISELKLIEAGGVRYLASMAQNLLPWQTAPAPEKDTQGFYRLKLEEIPGQPEFLVQLPPEYNPYKKYPCVLALCDINSSPLFEIEWWDGQIRTVDGYRSGQASRNGYIVIAPDWRKPLEATYDYDPFAANIVMKSLRKSLRTFSIDPNRVFLSGHAIGAEVAWDIGLAHPDIWAGVMPISAVADRYINFYEENAKYHLPMYFVLGELHLPPPRGMLGNADKREDVFGQMALSTNYNFIVVTYIGRQSEHFLEEILNLFKWMKSNRRNFATPEHRFECNTMRSWDNFFWWFEMHDIPASQNVPPLAWDFVTSRRALGVEGEIGASATGSTTMVVSGGGEAASFWLSPQWVNMDKPLLIRWNGRSEERLVQPSRRVILEDLRTRSDTASPFWARVTYDRGWTSSDE